MIEACARHGYAETTTREIAALAGVSSKSIFRQYEDLDDCFLQLFDTLFDEAAARIAEAYESRLAECQSPEAATRRAFATLILELAEHPRESKLVIEDILAVGPPAGPFIERAEMIVGEMIQVALIEDAVDPVLLPTVTRGMVGGIWFAARHHLLAGGSPVEMGERVDELARWFLSYLAPGGAGLPSGAAPVRWNEGRSLLDMFAADPRSQMLATTAELMVRNGYGSLSQGAIVELAEVRPDQFDAEFDDAEACFLATVDRVSAQALVVALRQSRAASSWEGSVCRAVRSMLQQLAEDPVLAPVVILGTDAVGVAGTQRRYELITGYARVLARRTPRRFRPGQVAAEAIVGTVWSVVHRLVIEGEARGLSALSGQLSYVVLAPLVGGVQAQKAIAKEFGSPRVNGARSTSGTEALAPFRDGGRPPP